MAPTHAPEVRPRRVEKPRIRSGVVGDAVVSENVVRVLSTTNPIVATCIMDRRSEIDGAEEAIAVSVDVRISRVGELMDAEVVRSGFGAPQLVDDCVIGPLLRRDFEGLPDFDVPWHVNVDFDEPM